MRQFVHLGNIRMSHNLYQPETITNVDKHNATVVAIGLHPAIEADLLANIRG